MVTRSQEIMMNLLENCGMSNPEAAVLTLTLKADQNFVKMADWLQSRGFKASEQEICNMVVDIVGYKRITE